MHSHLLILAMLSLRALAVFILTAHDHKDHHCTKKAIGKQIKVPESQCVVYQPEQPDANIQIKSHDHNSTHDYYLVVYSDTNCQNATGIVTPDEINVKNTTCYSTAYIADIFPGLWRSVSRNETIDITF